METLPREIINKMFLFIQHPVAELFKKSLLYNDYGNHNEFADDNSFTFSDLFDNFYSNQAKEREYENIISDVNFIDIDNNGNTYITNDYNEREYY